MSLSHYRDTCSELRYELKRKKRDIEDLEDKVKREETEAKRLKNENNDLWKLYYGLQQELQSAYERNAKLQVEKMTVEGLYEREKHDHEKSKVEASSNVQSSTTLKEALCAMQAEKIALQHKFNDLVVENKKLKDKEREIEPKLKELDDLKRRIFDFEHSINALQNAMSEQRTNLRDNMTRKEQVDSLRRYNNLLRQEGEQKNKKLQQWPTLIKALQLMERRLLDAERDAQTTRQRNVALAEKIGGAETLHQNVKETLTTFLAQCQELRQEIDAARRLVADLPPAFKNVCVDLNEKLRRFVDSRAAASSVFASAASTPKSLATRLVASAPSSPTFIERSCVSVMTCDELSDAGSVNRDVAYEPSVDVVVVDEINATLDEPAVSPSVDNNEFDATLQNNLLDPDSSNKESKRSDSDAIEPNNFSVVDEYHADLENKNGAIDSNLTPPPIVYGE